MADPGQQEAERDFEFENGSGAYNFNSYPRSLGFQQHPSSDPQEATSQWNIELSSSSTAGSSEKPGKRKRQSDSSEEEISLKPYECRFCPMKFAKSQALGGHMNRHRQEREREQLLHARQLVMQQGFPQYMLAGQNTVSSAVPKVHVPPAYPGLAQSNFHASPNLNYFAQIPPDCDGPVIGGRSLMPVIDISRSYSIVSQLKDIEQRQLDPCDGVLGFSFNRNIQDTALSIRNLQETTGFLLDGMNDPTSYGLKTNCASFATSTQRLESEYGQTEENDYSGDQGANRSDAAQQFFPSMGEYKFLEQNAGFQMCSGDNMREQNIGCGLLDNPAPPFDGLPWMLQTQKNPSPVTAYEGDNFNLSLSSVAGISDSTVPSNQPKPQICGIEIENGTPVSLVTYEDCNDDRLKDADPCSLSVPTEENYSSSNKNLDH